MTGQDFNSQLVFNQNTGSDFLFGTMAGWLTGIQRNPATCATTGSDRDFYGSGTTAPAPTAQLETAFSLFGRTGDVSVNLGGTGAGNQRFPDSGRPVVAADFLDTCGFVHNAESVATHARALGSYTATKKDGVAVSRLTNSVATGVAPDPTLEQLDPQVNWGAALLHVGAEGLNPQRGQLNAQAALGLLHDFVADSVSVAVTHKVRGKRVDFAVSAASAVGSQITKYRWDFGDGSPIVETTVPSVTHEYGKGARGTYTVYVQAVTELTRSGVGSASVRIIRN